MKGEDSADQQHGQSYGHIGYHIVFDRTCNTWCYFGFFQWDLIWWMETKILNFCSDDEVGFVKAMVG